MTVILPSLFTASVWEFFSGVLKLSVLKDLLQLLKKDLHVHTVEWSSGGEMLNVPSDKFKFTNNKEDGHYH